MSENSRKFRQECMIWGQCFIVSTVAVFFAYDYQISQLEGPLKDGMEIGLSGLLRNMWSLFLMPWIILFSGLSVARFLVVFGLDKFMKAKKST